MTCLLYNWVFVPLNYLCLFCNHPLPSGNHLFILYINESVFILFCCFCCGHPFTMLGVSLFISCKNKIQCVCVKKKIKDKKKKKYNIGQIFIPSFFILHSLFFLQSPHSGILKSIFILTVLKFHQIMSSYASPSIHSILGSYFQLEDSCLSKPQGNFLFLLLLVFWLLLLPPFHCSETLIR